MPFHRFLTRQRILNPIFQRTDAGLKAFLKAYLFHGATDDQVDLVADEYSEDPMAVGRPPQPPEIP